LGSGANEYAVCQGLNAHDLSSYMCCFIFFVSLEVGV